MALKKYNGIEYQDSGIDYSEQMALAEENGDYTYAAALEKQHNAKVLGEGLDYELSYKYSSPENYGIAPSSKSTVSSHSGTSRSSAIDGMLKDIQGMSFSYDPNSDPLYANYKASAEKSAKQVSEDVLANYAAQTGGVPSSYAISAASQAAGGQMQEADNMIPELYKLALEKYSADKADKYNQLGILMDLDNTEYNRGVYADETAYSRQRDTLDDERYIEDRDYNRGVYADETAYSRQRDTIGDNLNAKQTAKEDQQTALNNVIALLSEGIPIKQEMLDDAGLDHLTPETAKEAILSGVYSGGGGNTPKPIEKEKLSSSNKQALYKYITSDDFTTDGLNAYLSSYDWDKYDAEDVYNYISTNFSDDKDTMKVVSEHFNVDFVDDDKVSNQTKLIADNINAVYHTRSNNGIYVPLSVASDGTYKANGNQNEIIKAVLNNNTLNDSEKNIVLKNLGITQGDLTNYYEQLTT